MSVAGQVVVGDRRPFATDIASSPTVPDLTVVTAVYLYVLRGSGQVERWDCSINVQTTTGIVALYAPQPGDNDTPGETIHLRPYLVIPSQADTPCTGYEIQVVAK